MAHIRSIEVRVWTKGTSWADTDDNMYLGLGGREFRLDTSRDDFEKGDDFIFRLGDGHNVLKSKKNDPRDPQLDTAGDLAVFPVYIRKAGTRRGRADDAWHVERVDVTVNSGANEIVFSRLGGRTGGALWLSNESGLMFNLKLT